MIKFGGIPQEAVNKLHEIYEDCKKHLECKDCPHVGNVPLEYGEGDGRGVVMCETGASKKRE